MDIEQLVRDICLAFPEVTERLSHGNPGFFVGRQFVMLWPEGHHDHDFPHLWCAAPAGAQGARILGSPKVFFRPPYVGARGWLGVRLDGDSVLPELPELCEDAYRMVAPRRLISLLDEREDPETTG